MPAARPAHGRLEDLSVAEPFETWGRLLSRASLANVLHVLAPWLLFGLGGGLAAWGDTRGWVPLTVLGLVIALPAFAWFGLRVVKVLFSDEEEPDSTE